MKFAKIGGVLALLLVQWGSSAPVAYLKNRTIDSEFEPGRGAAVGPRAMYRPLSRPGCIDNRLSLSLFAPSLGCDSTIGIAGWKPPELEFRRFHLVL
jgi:hypothetical protein